MDPRQTLLDFWDNYDLYSEAGDFFALDEAVLCGEELIDWLDGGGFSPFDSEHSREDFFSAYYEIEGL